MTRKKTTPKPDQKQSGNEHTKSNKSPLLKPGLTVIFDELEVGVGRHIYYLYSETSERQEALKEFRHRFFKRVPADHWAWIARGLSIHPGKHWPKSLPKFPGPPKALEAHWPG